MLRRFSRSLPAIVAALAVMLVGTASFALARDGTDRHRAHRGHDHGHGYKACHGKRVSGLDARWLRVHVETNLFEIAGGEAAVQRATTDEVRQFGAHLV